MKKRFFSRNFFQGLLALVLELELRKANSFRREQIFICIELQRRTFARKKSYSESLKFGCAANEITKSKFATCIDLTEAKSALKDQLYHF